MKKKKWLPGIIVGLCALGMLAALRVPRTSPGRWRRKNSGGCLSCPVDASSRSTRSRASPAAVAEKQRANLEPLEELVARTADSAGHGMAHDADDEAGDGGCLAGLSHRQSGPQGTPGLPADRDPARGIDGKHYAWNQVQAKFSDLERETARASQKEAGNVPPMTGRWSSCGRTPRSTGGSSGRSNLWPAATWRRRRRSSPRSWRRARRLGKPARKGARSIRPWPAGSTSNSTRCSSCRRRPAAQP